MCLKVDFNYNEQKPLDIYSEGYWNSIFDYSGKVVYDGFISGVQGVGADLGKAVIGKVAQGLGIPPVILSLAGFGGGGSDISNTQTLEEIDRLIKEQTEILIQAIDDNNDVLFKGFESLLTQSFTSNCVNLNQSGYKALVSNLGLWNAYDPVLKARIDQRTNMLERLSNLIKIRQEYSNYTQGWCFYGQHVEYFSWIMNLYSFELQMRTNYQNVVALDNTSRKYNMEVDFDFIRNSVQGTLHDLEQSLEDVQLTGDKANFIWDDVLLTSTPPTYSYINNIKECINVEIDPNSTVYKRLKAALPPVQELINDGARPYVYRVESCPDESIYSIDNISYRLTKYRYLFDYTESAFCRRTICVRQSEILVAENILKADAPDVLNDTSLISNACPGWRAKCDDFNNFRNNIFSYKQDLDYSLKLQATYLPYTESLDSFWANSNLSRPENKFDRELHRVGGLSKLDNDNFGILEEILSGDSPREYNESLSNRWNLVGEYHSTRGNGSLNPKEAHLYKFYTRYRNSRDEVLDDMRVTFNGNGKKFRIHHFDSKPEFMPTFEAQGVGVYSNEYKESVSWDDSGWHYLLITLVDSNASGEYSFSINHRYD